MTRPAWHNAVLAAAATGVVAAAGDSALGAQVLPHNSQALANMRTQAEAGDPLAQYDLAAVYHAGHGVARDDAAATRWYERAAEQGFVLAQIELATLHAEGRGPQPDNATAYMWLDLAAARSRGQVRSRALARREAVAAEMTPEQVAEARRRARERGAVHRRR